MFCDPIKQSGENGSAQRKLVMGELVKIKIALFFMNIFGERTCNTYITYLIYLLLGCLK